MADANLFARFAQPVRSVADYLDQYDQQDARKADLAARQQQNAIQALTMRRQSEADARATDERNAFEQLARQYGTDRKAFIGALESSGRPGFMTQAQALRKADLDEADKQSQINSRTVKAEQERYQTVRDKLDMMFQVASAAKDQNSYMQGLRTLQAAGFDVSTVPQQYDPAYVEDAKQQALTAAQRLEQEWKAKEFGLKANNELIGPDGKVNQTLMGARERIAGAGAARSTVSINTGQKGLDNEFKLRGEFKQEPVYKAHQEMQAAHGQIKQAIAQASPAGDLAAATKIMKLLDPGSVVRESELGMAMQASGLMDRITNYGNMVVTGQKLTPTQRKDFATLADRLMGESVRAYNGKRAEYDRLGGEYGLNSGRALGPGAPDVAPAAAPAGQPGSLTAKEAAELKALRERFKGK